MYSQNISIIVPVFNEEENIEETLFAISNYIRRNFTDYEIIVIDNKSTDRTREILNNLKIQIPHLKIILHESNKGYAGNLRSGFKAAIKDLIFLTVADLQFDIKELEQLIPLIDKYDIVAGYKLKRHDPWGRKLSSWLYNFTMRLLFNLKLKDINCGFNLYRRAVIESVDFMSNLKHGVINVEIFHSALKNGFTIGQVGVHHYPRTKGLPEPTLGKLGSMTGLIKPKIIREFLKETFQLWRKIYFSKK